MSIIVPVTPALCLHHVGARAGTRDFPVLEAFEKDVVNVLYEPDSASIPQIEERVSRLSSVSHIYPFCLGKENKASTLYVYNDRYFSSLLRMRKDFENTPYYNDQFFWDVDPKAYEVVEEIPVELRSLDDILADPDFGAPPPDFLSIDTQGTELDILEGAESVISSKTLAIFTEVGLRQSYVDQPLLCDISRFLESHGFILAHFRVFDVEGAGFDNERTPIGLRGRGPPFEGEALYLKKPSYLLDKHEDPFVDICKLSFISFVYSCYDYTYRCLRYLDEVTAKDAANYSFIEFMLKYRNAMHEYPRITPVKYSTVLPEIFGKSRFATSEKKADRSLFSVQREYFSEVSPTEFRMSLPKLVTDGFIGVEKLAVSYGMETHAETLKESRLRLILGLLRRLGLATELDNGDIKVDTDAIARL